ncbi:MAG: SDR family oxidoreductase [Burkholderiales bacterium]|nr:SDR family oxidoreductase [Burkholderiales bacterium]
MSATTAATATAAGRLQGRVALVVGAGTGIGRATATLFAQEGARVALADIRLDAVRSLARALGDAGCQAEAFAVDVTDEDSVRQLVAGARQRFGELHTLFNSVGGSAPDDGLATELDLAVWERTLTLDLRGTLLTARHAIPAIIDSGGGTVVNMSSGAALLGTGRAHAYASAKGAVNSLTRALAGAYARSGVRVNAICAGRINTERVRQAYGMPGGQPGQGSDHFRAEEIARTYPYWVGEPEDIARIALFLAGDESRMITGSCLEANGGRTAY